MPVLDRATILQARDATMESVDVPEWCGSVNVRVMDGRERDQFEGWYLKASETKAYTGFRARLAAATICDEHGTLLFTPEDLPVLELKSSAALQRVYEVAMRINKMTQQDQEDLEKNLDAAPVDASLSA
jgi:hypothetical protein